MRIVPLTRWIDSTQEFRVHRTLRFVAGVALCGAMLSTAMSAVGRDNLSDAQANYQNERANCLNGRSNEDRATCLKEAGAALQEAKRGRLNDASAQYQQNAMIRCQALAPENRQACERRMQGEGMATGSAASGGIYRELVIEQPTPGDGSTPGDNVREAAPGHAAPADKAK